MIDSLESIRAVERTSAEPAVGLLHLLRNSIGFVMLTPGATLNLTAGEYRTNVFVNGSSTYGLRIEGQEAGSQMYPAGADDTVRDYYDDRLTAGR